MGQDHGFDAVPCTQLFRIVDGPRRQGSQPNSADQGRPVLHGAQGGGCVARGLHAAPEGESAEKGVGRGKAFSYTRAQRALHEGLPDWKRRQRKSASVRTVSQDLQPRCLRCCATGRTPGQTCRWSFLKLAQTAKPARCAGAHRQACWRCATEFSSQGRAVGRGVARAAGPLPAALWALYFFHR